MKRFIYVFIIVVLAFQHCSVGKLKGAPLSFAEVVAKANEYYETTFPSVYGGVNITFPDNNWLGYTLNQSTFNTHSLLVYGNPNNIPSYKQTLHPDPPHVPRYLGYSATGNYIFNPQYTVDTMVINNFDQNSIWKTPQQAKDLISPHIVGININNEMNDPIIKSALRPSFIEGMKNVEPAIFNKLSPNWESVPWENYYIILNLPTQTTDGSALVINGSSAQYYFVIPLRRLNDIPTTITVHPNPINIIDDTTSSTASGVIRADDRDAQKYDTTQGIPSSESVYVNISGQSYLYDYQFSEHSGTKEYSVQVQKTYTLKWEEDTSYPFTHVSTDLALCNNIHNNPTRCGGHIIASHDDKSEEQTTSQTVTFERPYSYWTIDHIAIYQIDQAEVTNAALPTGSVTLSPVGYMTPNLYTAQEPIHLTDPSTTTIQLPPKTVDGGSSRPAIPNEDFKSQGNSSFGNIKVNNDSIILNGTTIMSSTVFDSNTTDPVNFPTPPTISRDILYKKNIKVDALKANGTYSSTGTLDYTRIAGNIGATDATREINITVNPVTIHTPVVCDGGIYSNTTYNQELAPTTARATVILGMATSFRLLTTGAHKNIPGYGAKDYEAFTSKKQVRFPFDVYLNTTTADQSKFVPANTWYDVPLTQDNINIYVPTWVNEGDYAVDYRAIAINAPNTTSVERAANLDLTHYVATDSSPVHLAGRLYGFKITDIQNYPLWENVFKTGNHYYSGVNNQNGISRGATSPYILPIMEGSHPTVDNQALPTGYTFKYEVETVGDYAGTYAAIEITPEFYYVSAEGTNKQDVDLYYSNEIFDGKTQYFVKIDDNTLNRKNIKYCTMGDPYRNVSETDLVNTANIIGMTPSAFKSQKAKLGYLDLTVLTNKLRTFTGDTSHLPAGVNRDDARASIQHWYGEYYLPNEIFAAPKGFNVSAYAKSHGGLDGKENFWLRKGYIVVNFDLSTHKDIHTNSFLAPTLSYAYGQSNMWQIEGYDTIQRDSKGVDYNLEWGDIVFYYTNYRSSEDYSTKGTH